MLKTAVCELQAIIDLPLQIDTANICAMEAALRRYNGKAMINSVNGKAESMAAVFPLVKKYGGVVVALTLDENGIPSTAEKRVEIAKKILATAAEYGIDKKDIVFDTLTMAASTDPMAPGVTLRDGRVGVFEVYQTSSPPTRIVTEPGCRGSVPPPRESAIALLMAFRLSKVLLRYF